MEPHRASPLCLHLPELARQAARQPPRHHPADRRHYHQDRPYRHLRHRPKPLSKRYQSQRCRNGCPTFSAMLSEATGTTPSLHRLFAYISQNWRGKPLVSHHVIIQLIGATTTKTGLTVTCDIDQSLYPKGIKVSDAEMAAQHSAQCFPRRLELHHLCKTTRAA